MQSSVSDAKAQLTDLVRRAEAGDKIVLTRHGRPWPDGCNCRPCFSHRAGESIGTVQKEAKPWTFP